MVSVKEAYVKAKKEFPDFQLVECVDIGDGFAFYFSPSEDAVGIPYVTVDKTSGDVGFLTIPPLENLDLISNGKRIKVNI